MGYLPSRNEYSSYFAAAFKAGLGDSINPCVLASVLIFIMYFSFLGKSNRHIFFLGFLYIFAAVRMQQMIVAGLWDGLLLKPLTQWAINIVYFFVAAAFIARGALYFLDWRAYRFNAGKSRLRLNIPAFLYAVKERTVKSGIRSAFQVVAIAILAFLTGAIFTLMAAIYPQTEYMYIVHSFWASGGDKALVNGMFFYYSMAMALPVITAWAALMLGNLSFKGRENTQACCSGVMAALYCSGGLGLGGFVLQNILGLLT